MITTKKLYQTRLTNPTFQTRLTQTLFSFQDLLPTAAKGFLLHFVVFSLSLTGYSNACSLPPIDSLIQAGGLFVVRKLLQFELMNLLGGVNMYWLQQPDSRE